MSDYQPIPCAQHERLEFSVLKKIPLRLEFLRGSEVVHMAVIPLDVRTAEGAEWLSFRPCAGGEAEEIRLDRIVTFAEQPK